MSTQLLYRKQQQQMDDSTGNHVEENNYQFDVSHEEITSIKEQQQTNSQETIESPNSELLNGIYMVKRPTYVNEYDFIKVEPRMLISKKIVNSSNSKPYVSFENKTEWKNSLKEESNAIKGCELRCLAKDVSSNVFTRGLEAEALLSQSSTKQPTDTPQVTKKDYDKRRFYKTG